MKKVFVSMMLAGALLAGGSAYAQAQTDANSGATAQKECCTTEKAGKEGKERKKVNKPQPRLAREKVNRSQFNPFDGVQLTEDQQQKIQVLQQGLGPVVLDKEQLKNIPENKDLTPEQRKQLKEERDAKKLETKKNYLNGVKEVLTPEQYVIFLENVYLYAPQEEGKNPAFNSARPGKKGGKAPRGDKAGRAPREVKQEAPVQSAQ